MRATVDWRTNEKFFDDEGVITMKFSVQLEILKSAEVRFETKLLELQNLVRADLFDSEVEVARELLKGGFLRAAGGVTSTPSLRQSQGSRQQEAPHDQRPKRPTQECSGLRRGRLA